MDKLYWIVCEEGSSTLFEGRHQARTRGAAMKFLKDRIGRPNLSGVVFTITEIPVPLIREIVAEVIGGLAAEIESAAPAPEPDPAPAPERKPKPEPPAKPKPAKSQGRVGNPGHGDEFWSEVRTHWEACGNLRETARQFGLSPNSVKTRARREGWKK